MIQTDKLPRSLLSGNVSKYQFLTGEDFTPEKGSPEKAPAVKRFEYSPLGMRNALTLLKNRSILLKRKKAKETVSQEL